MTPTPEDHEAAAQAENTERRWKMLGGHPVGCDCSLCVGFRAEAAAALSEAVRVAVEGQQKIVTQAMDALESDATLDQRREAWDALRDAFFPLPSDAQATPAPERWLVCKSCGGQDIVSATCNSTHCIGVQDRRGR